MEHEPVTRNPKYASSAVVVTKVDNSLTLHHCLTAPQLSSLFALCSLLFTLSSDTADSQA